MGGQTLLAPSNVSDGIQMAARIYGSGSAFTDLGVMANGFTSTFQTSSSEIEFGNKANPDKVHKNLKLQISPSEFYTIKNSNLALLSGGVITETVTAGTLVAGAEQTIDSGDWGYLSTIELTGKNSSGAVPTINSVTGGTDGALTVNVDYFITTAPGGWAIYFVSGTNISTLAQDIVVDTDYTPTASSVNKAGTSSITLNPIELQIRHYTDAALTTYDYELIVYRCFVDAGSLVETKNGARSDTDFDTYTFTLTGECDDTRAVGDQLFAEQRDA